MKKLILKIVALILFAPAAALAQYTSVTATVTSPNSTVWANATYQITFIPYVIGTISKLNGADFTQSFSGILNGSGQLSVSLADNNIVTPALSQWRFYLCMAVGTPCFQTQITITGASMDISSQLNALAPNPSNNVVPNPSPGTATIKPFPSNQPGLVIVGNNPQTAPLAVFADHTGSLGFAITPKCLVFPDGTCQISADAPGGTSGQVQYNNSGAFGGFGSWNGTLMTAPLSDQGGQVFNVKAYGAKGDGVTNDSPAIQTAFSAAEANGGVLYFPPTSSCYLVSTTLNFTNVGKKVTILGAGGTGAASAPSTGLICGNTGGAVFDITMAYNLTFRNVDVTATKTGLSSPSLYGVIAGRNVSGASGQFNKFIDCRFQMPVHTSGTTYSFGIYLYGEELVYMWGDIVAADCPLFIGSSNVYSLNSTNVPWGSLTTYSETAVYADDLDLSSNGLLPALYIYGGFDIKMAGIHVWNGSQANPYPAGLYNYAVRLTSNSYLPNHDITITNLRQEGYPGLAYVDGGLQDSKIQGTDAPAPTPTLHAVEFNGASSDVRDVDFDIYDEFNSSANFYYDATAGSPVGLWSLDSVNFYCGQETNCVNIPLGQGTGTGTAYWHNLNWSRAANNASPVIDVSIGATALPLTGSFSIPTTAVAANSCSTLTAQSASGAPANAYIEIHPQFWANLLVTAGFLTGQITPQVCNLTTSPITPASGITATFRIVQ